MIGVILDSLSVKAGERYVNFLLSLRGVLSASSGVPVKDNRAFANIRMGSYEVAQTFMESEVEFFERDLQSLQDRARALAQSDVLSGAPSKTLVLSDYADELVTWFRQELRSQIERDINTAVQKRREIALDATLMARSKGYSEEVAYQLASSRRGGVNFYFKDRAGRKYPSQKFIRQLYRQGLITIAIESYALEAAAYGVAELEIVHPDNNHGYVGERITLVEKPNMLTLAEVRDEVFHPNSNAFLRAVV